MDLAQSEAQQAVSGVLVEGKLENGEGKCPPQEEGEVLVGADPAGTGAPPLLVLVIGPPGSFEGGGPVCWDSRRCGREGQECGVKGGEGRQTGS